MMVPFPEPAKKVSCRRSRRQRPWARCRRSARCSCCRAVDSRSPGCSQEQTHPSGLSHGGAGRVRHPARAHDEQGVRNSGGGCAQPTRDRYREHASAAHRRRAAHEIPPPPGSNPEVISCGLRYAIGRPWISSRIGSHEIHPANTRSRHSCRITPLAALVHTANLIQPGASLRRLRREAGDPDLCLRLLRT